MVADQDRLAHRDPVGDRASAPVGCRRFAELAFGARAQSVRAGLFLGFVVIHSVCSHVIRSSSNAARNALDTRSPNQSK
jgi:hypothetical protein